MGKFLCGVTVFSAEIKSVVTEIKLSNSAARSLIRVHKEIFRTEPLNGLDLLAPKVDQHAALRMVSAGTERQLVLSMPPNFTSQLFPAT